MENLMEILNQIWAVSLVRFIVYLGIAFLAAFLSKWLITKLLKLVKLDKVFDKWGINDGVTGTSLSFVGRLVFIIVFLIFLPTALEALGITSVSGPINGFVSTFIEYLPKIIAAVILVYVGVFVAQILGQIALTLLRKTKIDSFIKRNDEDQKVVLLSDILAKVLMAVIILITIVQALLVLNIEAISAPALMIVESIFGAIPSIILAVVVISCGLLVASIACALLGNILLGVNFDGMVKKVLPQMKVSATKIVVNVVRTIIILFVVGQGIQVLNLAILTSVVTAVIGYLPLVIKSFIIGFVAFVGASMLESFLLKSSPKAAAVAKIVKVAIFVLAGFMILSQLDIASTIVNTAFVITMAAIAISFALAFGLGGKDFAKKTLDRVDEKIEQCKSSDEENK